MNTIQPLSQVGRPPCSIALSDADLSLDNANWTKGLQSMSDWIWSANLNPNVFPNHLGRFLLQIPGIFEQQLNFSTSLIFDEPSFRNGTQVSGFVNRVSKELVISFIAQARRSWYSMSHHAILGKFTAAKHGMDEATFTNRMINLLEYDKFPQYFSPLESRILDFTKAFATDPKTYSRHQIEELKDGFRRYNKENYARTDRWLLEKEASAYAGAEELAGNSQTDAASFAAIRDKYQSRIPEELPDEMNERKINAQIVELAFLCLQFVALTCVFTGLNIPDEAFLGGVMTQMLSDKVIQKINELNEIGLDGNTPPLIPPAIGDNNGLIDSHSRLFKAVTNGQIRIRPTDLKGARIPLTPYEGKDGDGQFRPAFAGTPDRDKGLTIGGVQTGVYGWGYGGHFPGSLVYCLMHHPELARFEAPYSLPVLFNEDEWRNGVQTAGYVPRKMKELVIQKVYKTNRSRYGLEHHIMFFYNSFLDEYGVGRITNPLFSPADLTHNRNKALSHAELAALYIHDHRNAPPGVYSRVEEEILTWTEKLLQTPHWAWQAEAKVRLELKAHNELEIARGTRVLDTSPGIGKEAALSRLIDHQVGELTMMIGHMDGLGRVLTILQLEAEDAVQMVEGDNTGGKIRPALDAEGNVQFTGYFNNRPALHNILNAIGVSDKVQTLAELFLNPMLCTQLASELEKDGNYKYDGPVPDHTTSEF